MKNIALFSYDFHHRKTHDFILDLVGSGVRGIVVLAAGIRKLDGVDSRSYFDESLRTCPPLLASELCARLGIPFFQVEHDDYSRIDQIVQEYCIDLAIISGARIIKKEVISLFPDGVINFHPGKLPETSGLDSLFYTLKNGVPAGVTTHFIDQRVDAGSEIYFDEVIVTASSTPETVKENIYQMQRVALRRVVSMLMQGCIPSRPIHRPAKNPPMTPEQKIEAVSRFATWRAARFTEQEYSRLMAAAESGDLMTVERILDKLPQLLGRKNDSGWSPLIVAAYHGHLIVAEFLLKKGANPNDTGLKGTTVLMYAKSRLLHSSESSYALLDLLISHGADVARCDCFGRTVLDYVSECGDQRMVQYFRGILQ